VALSFGTAEQNDVARRLAGRAYSACTTDQKGEIDSSGAKALAVVNRHWDFVGGAGAADAPDEWSYWLRDLASFEAAVNMRQDLIPELRSKAAESKLQALRSFSRTESNDTSSTDLAFDVLSLRRSVLSRCLARERLLLPSFDLIDREIKATVAEVWNEAGWSWTTRVVKLTIAADQSVLAADFDSGTGVEIDRILDSHFRYIDDASICRMVDADAIMTDRSNTAAVTGRPRVASVHREGSTLTWMFAPIPDAQYEATVKAELRTPLLASYTNLNTALAMFPTDFHGLTSDLLYGRVLYAVNTPDGRDKVEEARRDLAGMGPERDEVSPGGAEIPRPVYGLGPPPMWLGGDGL